MGEILSPVSVSWCQLLSLSLKEGERRTKERERGDDEALACTRGAKSLIQQTFRIRDSNGGKGEKGASSSASTRCIIHATDAKSAFTRLKENFFSVFPDVCVQNAARFRNLFLSLRTGKIYNFSLIHVSWLLLDPVLLSLVANSRSLLFPDLI